MLRNIKPKHNEVVADMSQFSVESARNDIQKQYYNLRTERTILKKRKIELERLLCQAKTESRTLGRITDTRKGIVTEIDLIQKRLIEIKPILHQLHQTQFRNDGEILEDILVVLNQILEKIS